LVGGELEVIGCDDGERPEFVAPDFVGVVALALERLHGLVVGQPAALVLLLAVDVLSDVLVALQRVEQLAEARHTDAVFLGPLVGGVCDSSGHHHDEPVPETFSMQESTSSASNVSPS
jgi:hypothetical protein